MSETLNFVRFSAELYDLVLGIKAIFGHGYTVISRFQSPKNKVMSPRILSQAMDITLCVKQQAGIITNNHSK